MKVWIDDERQAPDETWEICRTGKDAVAFIIVNFPVITEISFDHDLGGEITGYDVIDIIERVSRYSGKEKAFAVIKMTVHSANAPGAANIQAVIYRMKKHD